MSGSRTRSLVMCILVAGLAVLSVYAETLDVRYAEGSVSVQRRDAWISLDLGGTVAIDATVQVGPNGYLELGRGEIVLRLSRPGIYRIERLLAARVPKTAETIFSRVLSRLTAFTREDTDRRTVVAGTRATGAEDVMALEWAGGESALELVDRGRQELAEGRVDAAVEIFDEAALYAYPRDAPVAEFYLGFALFLQGDVRDALYHLTLHEPDRDQDFHDEHVVILAHTYLELSDPEPAVELLTRYLSERSDEHALRPGAYLLLGIAYRMCGDATNARNAFLRVMETAPDAPEADAAAELLTQL